MNKFQNYKHYKLPITIEPLKYGKLILNILELNLFVIQINKTNIALINQYEELSKVKLFREGDFILEYTDIKTSENSFVRTINNKKYTFIESTLTSIEKIINRDIMFIKSLLIKLILKINSTTLLKIHKNT